MVAVLLLGVSLLLLAVWLATGWAAMAWLEEKAREIDLEILGRD